MSPQPSPDDGPAPDATSPAGVTGETLPRPSRWVADAEAYDAWFDGPWGTHASSVEHHLLLAGADVAGGRVLDAGCGTGRLAARLERAGAVVTGIDRDPAALALARRRARGPLVVGDVHALPFPGDRFDVTFAVTVCEFAADPAAAIAELVRVTRPGGRVVIGSLDPHSPWGWWHRRRFDAPPWSEARFLTADRLAAIGRTHGTIAWRAGLRLPRDLPGMRRWGPLVERLGGALGTRWAAFRVLTIDI